MPFEQLLVVAAAAMSALLAVSRVVRVHLGRPPHPEGKARPLFLVTLLLLPPIALEAVVLHPTTSATQLHVLGSILIYLGALIGFSLLMGIAALVVRLIAPGRSRPLLMLALVGSEGDPDAVPFDPPLTSKLAEGVALVDRANAVFPRGPAFQAAVDRPDFRADWDALDAATRTLEERIDHDRRLGSGVAQEAAATATDARSRLDSLRRLAIEHGQAWTGS